MITPSLYETLSESERRLWHSHVYEVKSGMLIMPNTNPIMPTAVWDAAETREMEQVVQLYGKVFHLWQTDRGDKLPLGEPKLMTSFTQDGQMKDWDKAVGDRDRRFGDDWRRKKELRKGIEEMEVHPGECERQAATFIIANLQNRCGSNLEEVELGVYWLNETAFYLVSDAASSSPYVRLFTKPARSRAGRRFCSLSWLSPSKS